MSRPCIAALALLVGWCAAQEATREPAPIATTRWSLKEVLEAHRSAKPRLTPPPATDADKAKGRSNAGQGGMRRLLDPDLRANWPRDWLDDNMPLTKLMRNELLWVTSRVNNCLYWLGHQENGLAVAGLDEKKYLGLDGDWKEFTPAERAAFTAARKLSFEPHRWTRADFNALRKHHTEMETLEILLWVSSYCDTNRWAIGLNTPLEVHRKFVTEKPTGFADGPSLVAPLSKRDAKATAVECAVAERPKLESRVQVEAKLAECLERVPLLPLASARDTLAYLPGYTRKDAPGVIPDGAEVAMWMRQYALFPKTGGYKVASTVAEAARGKIDALLRARINWICARHDRAWYALGQAKRRLMALGQSEDAVYALDGDWSAYPEKDRLVFAFARKMTVAPALVTDKDVADLRKHFSDTRVAELVHRASSAAMINRMGEACNLPLEPAVPAYDTLGTEQAKAWQGRPDRVLVDVRDSNSFNGWALDGERSGGRIAGAVNVAVEWVERGLTDVKEHLEAKGILGGEKQLLLYGRTAAEASGMARLLETRYGVARARLHVYKDGFAAWAAAGLPTDRLERHEWLVPPSWLERERKANPALRVFAVSWNNVAEYERGHVPGSFYLDTNLLETPPIWDLLPRDKLVGVMLSLGITRDTPVVVYGPQPMPSFFAAAVLRHVGVKDVRVLNGGYPAWEAAGLPVEKGRNRPKPQRVFADVPAAPGDVFVGIAEARKLLAGPNKVLVDVRSWKEYVGETPGYDDITAKGRVPGAVWGRGGSCADKMEDYRNPDGTMRDHRDIERAWRKAGITPKKAAGFYCGTGWRASEAYTAARMMGWDDVVIYDGGWYEWSADKKNPIATGEPAAPPSGGAKP